MNRLAVSLSVVCLLSAFLESSVAKKTVIINQAQSVKSDLQQDTVAFEKVKSMYVEFVKLIESGVNDAEVTAFFNKHFNVDKITEKFTGSKIANAQLTSSLIKYFKFLLSGQVIRQVKDYSLDDNFSQVSRKRSVNMLCKLKNNKGGLIDMSVTLEKETSKILELSFMRSIYLIKGAKNIVDLYCQEKVLNYKGMEASERIKICGDALTEYVNKQSKPKAN